MTKLRNKLVLAILALCLAMFAGVFVACGGSDEGGSASLDYTVTVKADGAAASGVKVTVKKGKTPVDNKKTGADGKATFKLPKDSGYTVALSDLPAGCAVPEGELGFGDKYELTVNLESSFYTVKLVKEDGSPFYAENVTVGICLADSGNCLTPVRIGTDGVAKIDAAKDNYHIQIIGLPQNYAYANEEKYALRINPEYGNYFWENSEDRFVPLSATVTEQTVTICEVDFVEFETPLSAAKLAEYEAAGYEIRGSAYGKTGTVPAKSTAYFAFTAEFTGNYMFYYMDDASYMVNREFRCGENGSEDDSYVNPYANHYGYQIAAVKGKTYYINATNDGDSALDLEFVLAAPGASAATATGAGDVPVTVYTANASAIIAFSSAAPASFKVTDNGSATAIGCYADYSDAADMWKNLDVGDYAANSEVSFKYTQKLMGTTVYLAVAVKADAYPATVTVNIAKLHNIPDTQLDKPLESTLAQFADGAAGKSLTPVPFSASLTKNPTDGYYYDNNGNLIVVNLTGNLPTTRFNVGGQEVPLLYLELYSNFAIVPYVIDATPSADLTALDKGYTYDDYRMMLRGFKDYAQDERGNSSIPTGLTGNFYAKYVNSDGVYPLNDELKSVLQLMTAWLIDYEERTNNSVLPNAADECLWMFPCFYYGGSADQGEASPIYTGFAGLEAMLQVFDDDTAKFFANAGDNNWVMMAHCNIAVNQTEITIVDFIKKDESIADVRLSMGDSYKLTVTVTITGMDEPMEFVFDLTELLAEPYFFGYTVTRDAKLELFENGTVKFYLPDASNNYSLAASFVLDSMEEGSVTVEDYTYKNEALIKSIEFSVGQVNKGDEEGDWRYVITVKVTRADSTQKTYEFDMTEEL